MQSVGKSRGKGKADQKIVGKFIESHINYNFPTISFQFENERLKEIKRKSQTKTKPKKNINFAIRTKLKNDLLNGN